MARGNKAKRPAQRRTGAAKYAFNRYLLDGHGNRLFHLAATIVIASGRNNARLLKDSFARREGRSEQIHICVLQEIETAGRNDLAVIEQHHIGRDAAHLCGHMADIDDRNFGLVA